MWYGDKVLVIVRKLLEVSNFYSFGTTSSLARHYSRTKFTIRLVEFETSNHIDHIEISNIFRSRFQVVCKERRWHRPRKGLSFNRRLRSLIWPISLTARQMQILDKHISRHEKWSFFGSYLGDRHDTRKSIIMLVREIGAAASNNDVITVYRITKGIEGGRQSSYGSQPYNIWREFHLFWMKWLFTTICGCRRPYK